MAGSARVLCNHVYCLSPRDRCLGSLPGLDRRGDQWTDLQLDRIPSGPYLSAGMDRIPAPRRDFGRRGRCTGICAGAVDTVFLPGITGGLRLYVPRRFRDGPFHAHRWFAWQIVHPDDPGIWLRCPRSVRHADDCQPPRPRPDRAAGPVDVVLGAAAWLSSARRQARSSGGCTHSAL